MRSYIKNDARRAPMRFKGLSVFVFFGLDLFSQPKPAKKSAVRD